MPWSELVDDPVEGARARYVAGKDLAAFAKALGVDTPAPGHQEAIRALLLGLAQGRVGIAPPRTFAIGIGEVIEGDDLLEVEQGALLLVQNPSSAALRLSN